MLVTTRTRSTQFFSFPQECENVWQDFWIQVNALSWKNEVYKVVTQNSPNSTDSLYLRIQQQKEHGSSAWKTLHSHENEPSPEQAGYMVEGVQGHAADGVVLSQPVEGWNWKALFCKAKL